MNSRSAPPTPIDALWVEAMAIAMPRQAPPDTVRLSRLVRLTVAVPLPSVPIDQLLVDTVLDLHRTRGGEAAMAVLKMVLDLRDANAALQADLTATPLPDTRPWYEKGQMA